MDPMRRADAAARVVAWHNRHPLARRIAREEVVTVGVVELPFACDPARPERKARPVFAAGWLGGAAPTRLRGWASAHAGHEAAGGPRRRIDADPALRQRALDDGLPDLEWRQLLGLTLDGEGRRTRVLMAPRPDLRAASVFGARAWQRPRVAAFAAAATFALAATAWQLASTPQDPGAGGGQPVAQGESGTRATVPGKVEPAPHAGAEPLPPARRVDAIAGGATPSAGGIAQARTAAASTPTPGAPKPRADLGPGTMTTTPVELGAQDAAGAGSLVDLRRWLTPALRESARQAGEQARAQAQGTTSIAATPASHAERDSQAGRAPPVAGATSPGSVASAAGRSAPPMWAIATPPLPRQDDAIAHEASLRALATSYPVPPEARLESMAGRGGWRVVWWPLPVRERAEEMLLLARARGLRVELVEF